MTEINIAMKLFTFIGAVVVATLLSACATQQQPLVHDDADRLFLKYVDIAQRLSPMNSDEAEETADIMDRIAASKDTCTGWKIFKLLPVTVLMLAGGFTPITIAELQDKKEEARRDLKNLQDAAALGQYCPSRGFPQVQIN